MLQQNSLYSTVVNANVMYMHLEAGQGTVVLAAITVITINIITPRHGGQDHST